MTACLSKGHMCVMKVLHADHLLNHNNQVKWAGNPMIPAGRNEQKTNKGTGKRLLKTAFYKNNHYDLEL